MSHEGRAGDEIELSTFLSGPVADGLDGLERALKLFESSKGHTKEQCRRILVELNLMFAQLAPKTTSASHWEQLKREVNQAIT
jgi:hypothetical protein